MPLPNINALLHSHFDAAHIQKTESIQTLWSGYGEIARYTVTWQNGQQNYIIVKQVEVTGTKSHPRGWNTQASHARKIRSYQVEQAFYQRYSQLCDSQCYVPKFIAQIENNATSFLILEDLDQAGFSARKQQANQADVLAGIAWLAKFHARFMQHSAASLWPIGSYWHLATRQDELEKMAAHPLKHNAQQIDAQLNSAQFKTLIHGDAKIANLCFSPDSSAIAAVDFQYVGQGIGVKDLMYFLGSCLSAEQLEQNHQQYLDVYFTTLKAAIQGHHPHIDAEAVEHEWRKLYPVTWADFHRFLLGWSPQHFKINSFMQGQTSKALALLN